MRFSRRTKRVLLGFLFLCLLVLFIIVASFRFAESLKEKRRYEEEKAAIVPPSPNIVMVENKTLSRLRRYSAQLRPWMDSLVAAEQAGRIVEVLVEAGDPVEKGQPLVRIDERLAAIALEQAQARYEESSRLLSEAQRLLQTRAISQTAYQAQLAAVRVDQTNLAEAKERLARHTVRAPFSGYVDERLVDLGETINLHQPVARVVDLEKLRVEFTVAESDLASFSAGTVLTLQIPSIPGQTFHPDVDFVARSADTSTRLFRVEAVLENPDSTLPGGLQGIVEADVRRYEDFPFLPVAAVRFLGRKSLVWLVEEDGTGRQIEIEVGPEVDGLYPVLSGLNPGDRVLIK